MPRKRGFYKKKQRKTPYRCFVTHDGDCPLQFNENVLITAIDPGYVNCGIYTMAFNLKTGKKTSLCLDRLKFEKDNEKSDCIKQFDKLENERNLFSSSHYILVEEQMTQSIKNTRMGQHIQTYLMTRLRNKGVKPIIIEISNQTKTQYLNAPYGLPSKGADSIKAWCLEKAREFLKKRNSETENWFLQKLNLSKADDMGDSICYCEVFSEDILLSENFELKPKPVKVEIEA